MIICKTNGYTFKYKIDKIHHEFKRNNKTTLCKRLNS